MANLFETQPDSRQSTDPELKVTRFRPRYRALSDQEKALHDKIKAKAEELEALFGETPSSRYGSLAITSLEESIMWAIKALTA